MKKKKKQKKDKTPINVKKNINKYSLEEITIEEKDFFQFIEKTIKDMEKFLYFSFLTVSIVMNKDMNNNSIFSVKYLDEYKQLELTVHPRALELYINKEKEKITNYLTHELSHIYTIPLTDLAMDRFATKREIIKAGEKLTETISWYIKKYNNHDYGKGVKTRLIINNK